MSKMMRRLGLRGFTLIELLVVIAIIGVLAGMILPAIALARERARRARCQGNLSSIGKSMAIYSMDFNEKYPLHFYYNTPSDPGMRDYAGVARLYVCPSDSTRDSAKSLASAAFAATNCSYGLVARGAGAAPDDIHSFDKNGIVGTTGLPATGLTGWGGNHGDAGNLLFVDGSVMMVKTTEWDDSTSANYSTNIMGASSMTFVAAPVIGQATPQCSER